MELLVTPLPHNQSPFSAMVLEGEPAPNSKFLTLYRGANKGLHVLLSRTQAEPGRTGKQEQEEISRNHVQTFICVSVVHELIIRSEEGNKVISRG